MQQPATKLTVICDECGQRHEAHPSHESEYGQGQIYAVVCTRDWLTDYYTAERVSTDTATTTA